MDVEQRSGAEAPGVTARLQPERGHEPNTEEADTPASGTNMGKLRDLLERQLAEVDFGEGLDWEEHADLETARERLRRLGEDQQIVERLKDCGFTGPYFEATQGELIAYAFPVMMSWIRRGLIFQFCAHRGRPVTAPDHIRIQIPVTREQIRATVVGMAVLGLIASGTSTPAVRAAGFAALSVAAGVALINQAHVRAVQRLPSAAA